MTQPNRYASKTTVPVEKTKAEIETLLKQHGADQVMTAWESSRATIAFRIDRLAVRIYLPLPHINDFLYTERKNGYSTKTVERTPQQQQNQFDQAERQTWRAFLLIIKAKLEAVAAGVTSMEEQFLPHILLNGDTTIGDTIMPRLHDHIERGQLPSVFPSHNSAIPLPPPPQS